MGLNRKKNTVNRETGGDKQRKGDDVRSGSDSESVSLVGDKEVAPRTPNFTGTKQSKVPIIILCFFCHTRWHSEVCALARGHDQPGKVISCFYVFLVVLHSSVSSKDDAVKWFIEFLRSTSGSLCVYHNVISIDCTDLGK